MPDFDEILKMAANAQAELQKVQDNLEHVEVEGQAGGGLVKIRATAKGRILSVSIDDSLIVLEEKQMLEDLVTAAFNDAREAHRLFPGLSQAVNARTEDCCFLGDAVDRCAVSMRRQDRWRRGTRRRSSAVLRARSP